MTAQSYSIYLEDGAREAFDSERMWAAFRCNGHHEEVVLKPQWRKVEPRVLYERRSG